MELVERLNAAFEVGVKAARYWMRSTAAGDVDGMMMTYVGKLKRRSWNPRPPKMSSGGEAAGGGGG